MLSLSRKFMVKFQFQLTSICSYSSSHEIFRPHQQGRRANENIHSISATQSVVHGSAVSASPETLFEMNILHHLTRAAASESLGVELKNLFSQILQMVPMYTEA